MDYENLLSPGALQMRPSGIRKFFDLADEMEDCITLGVGEPDFKTPWAIREAGIRSLERGRTFYTSNAGLRELRQEICRFAERWFDLHYDPDHETYVTVGGSEAIDGVIRAFVRPGDEVLIPEPSFVCYHPLVTLAGGIPVPIALRAEDEFRLTAQQLHAAITPRTRLLVFPFPCNPTGAVMRKADVAAVAEVLRDTNVMVLSDELYGTLTYGGEPHVSIATMPGMRERTVVVNGFSKSHAMTGWRLGYAFAPAPVMQVLYRIHQSAIMCAPTTSQYAAVVAARDCDDAVVAMRDEYDMRRRFLMSRFAELGLPCFEPQGAFYVFPDIRGTGLSSDVFCERLLQEAGVAVIPGSAFGESGEGFVRISYAYALDHLAEAMRRIGSFLQTL